MTQGRFVTEHSPIVEETRARLVQEWMVQKATRNGTRPINPDVSTGTKTAFTNAALLCVRRGIDPAKLVTAALTAAMSSTNCYPSMLMSMQALHVLSAVTAPDSDGNEHKLISADEANYRAEWSKVRALLRNKVPALHLMDSSYRLRPLVRWVVAVRAGFDVTSVLFDASAEYKRNKAAADAVFGNDIFRGLRA